MDFIQTLKRNMVNFASWLDVASFCYDTLCLHIKNQGLFRAEYICPGESMGIENPNLDLLSRYENDIRKIIHEEKTDLETGILELCEQYKRTKEVLNPYAETTLNECTLIYFILTAISRHYMQAENRNAISLGAPLNKAYQNHSFVYFSAVEDMMQDARKKLGFRKIISEEKFFNAFEGLVFFEKEKCEGRDAPNIQKITWAYEEHKPSFLLEGNLNLKIEILPFGSEDVDLDFPRYKGKVFRVIYKPTALEKMKKEAIKLLEKSIEEKANIIVFPEFVCAEPIQKAIQLYLKNKSERNPEELKELVLVVAGTAWTSDDNNVMKIFNRSGELLGNYYKNAPFVTEEYYEGLSTPGKECTIIDVEGVGRVFPSICRDASEEDYPMMLQKYFNPFLWVIAAWSPSLTHGFERQLCNSTERFHTVGVLCNCCKAMKKVRAGIGLLSLPYKGISRCESTIVPLTRVPDDCVNCKKNLCRFVVEMNFSYENVKTKVPIKDKGA